MADKDDDDKGQKMDKEARYEKQVQEGREAVQESISAVEYARRKLDAALASLGKYGDAPFEDLER